MLNCQSAWVKKSGARRRTADEGIEKMRLDYSAADSFIGGWCGHSCNNRIGWSIGWNSRSGIFSNEKQHFCPNWLLLLKRAVYLLPINAFCHRFVSFFCLYWIVVILLKCLASKGFRRKCRFVAVYAVGLFYRLLAIGQAVIRVVFSCKIRG